MRLQPVRRQSTFWPCVWVRTIKAQRIRVVPIYINLGRCCRSDSTERPRLIIYRRHNNPRLTKVVDDVVPIAIVRKRIRIHGSTVLILRLKQNHWSAVGDLRGRDDTGNVCGITGAFISLYHLQYHRFWPSILISSVEVRFIACSQTALDSLEPTRKASTAHFGVHVWPRSLYFAWLQRLQSLGWVQTLQLTAKRYNPAFCAASKSGSNANMPSALNSPGLASRRPQCT